MTKPELAAALIQAECTHDRTLLADAITRIGGEIDVTLAGESAVFLTVMQGGLVFAGHLALAIHAPLEFDYIHATRYRSTTQGGELTWIKQPTLALHERNVLLVDDILDEGYTLQAIRNFCLAQGAKRVLLAVLCEKRHGRCVPGLAADFVGVEVPDRYVFGFGMDYYDQGRNLPGIYAL